MSFVGLLGPLAATQTGFGGPQFSNFMLPQQTGLSQQDEQELMRMGLLQAGLSILANNDGRGFGQAVGAGLLGGLNAYQQGKARKKGELLGASENARRDYRTMIADMYQQEQARREQERFGMQQQQFGWQQQQQQREQERQDATQKALASITATPGTPQWAQQMAQAAQAQGDVQSAARFGGMADPRIANAGREGQTLNTTAGVLTFGNGKWQPLIDPSTGKPYMSSSSLAYDPELAGEIAAARGGGKLIGEAGAKGDVNALEAEANARKILPIIDRVRELIGQSTGSGAGRLSDATAAVFGMSTDGAKAIAALRPLTSQILMSVPRFEGPQGVMDVEIYKQAAGQLDDPSVPRETRLAALETIKELQMKYARPQGGASTGQGQQNGQWRIVR